VTVRQKIKIGIPIRDRNLLLFSKLKMISDLLIGVGSISQENVYNLCVTLGSREVEGGPLVLVRTPSHKQIDEKHTDE
jgi:hypothetical protein